MYSTVTANYVIYSLQTNFYIMDKKKYIKEKIIRSFPSQVNIIGSETLDTIIELQLEGDKPEIFTPEEGKNLEFSTIITIVSIVVSSTDLTIKLIQYLRERGQKIEKSDLLDKVKSKLEIHNSEYDDFIEEVIDENA